MDATHTIHQTTLAKWIALIQEQQANGLTIKEWCTQNGFSTNSYYYWKHIAKEEYLKTVIPDIVPLPSPADPIPVLPAAETPVVQHDLYNLGNSKNSTSKDPIISISMNDIRIEIGASAPDALITKIIGALRNA